MQQLLYFIKKFRFFLLFLILQIVAFYFTVQYHSYQKSKFVNSANAVTGGFYTKMNNINEYFHLKTDNQLLIEENIRLKNLLEKRVIDNSIVTTTVVDTMYTQKYEYTSAKVVNNNYTKLNNFLTINKGSNNGILPELGVINGRGIIGVIKNTSANYATILSILNSSSKINVRLKNSNHFGTLVWNGKDYNITQITDIPRQALIKEGDTIITGGKSLLFPEGILVGVIKDFKIQNNQYTQINIALFNDMSAIGHVQVVKNLEKIEQLKLEQKTVNE
ncbi:rod shape-determining protein MreC [Lutibacter sp. HS1-25]|uniref:rod shape-determining protein MreC n=1 Tax=Lutibacter sp. HS1-25 TaxID=2485000 RepID=UPI001010C324|nr:rod shape-determining protein MreC [Lutibacter sp. HS1-25]RXP52961.1 rod shape-determining protein MreC [Lutibacter sp. HS1-25]